jgi:hypothetical protein
LSTKFRVVFDASAKTSTGISLNDTLLNGPTIQDDIFTLLIRFQKHRYVFISDLVKMYRQVLVDPNQIDLQRIIWPMEEGREPTVFRLKTMTYGTRCASFLSTRCLHQLAEESKLQFPVASNVIKKDFYMDDLISGADTCEEAKNLKLQIELILKTGGFELHKWASNAEELLENLDEKQLEEQITIQSQNSINTLGLTWCPRSDRYKYKVNISNKNPITKRDVISEIFQIFDPIGKLAPVIIVAKIFMQELWLKTIDWSETLRQKEHQNWRRFRTELKELENIDVQRWSLPSYYKPGEGTIEVHGFCDASEKAYGAAVYLKYTNNDKSSVSLLCAKAKVAPISRQTLPRLELLGVELLAKLSQKTLKALDFENVKCY